MRALALSLAALTLFEVNYPVLRPQSDLALFALFGLILCFMFFPASRDPAAGRWAAVLDLVLSLGTAACCLYLVIQTEPAFERFWIGGRSLGDRAGAESRWDLLVGAIGLLVVLEATRRCVGWALPILSAIFLAYAAWGQWVPDWLFPHRGYSLERIVAQVFLHGQGVFGIALSVMFTYVFLFVIFGAFLEATGATRFIIDLARRVFLSSRGGSAKVAVLASGLMGSLSGSAVANCATIGTFTIPLMRSAGFPAHVAAGLEAAASSGGALMPPVMGAGAYMMLEIIDPPVTYLQVIRAALIPAVLYYMSLFLFVHFYAKRLGAPAAAGETAGSAIHRPEGVVFFGALAALIVFLLAGYSVFRSVTLALGVVVLFSAFHPRTRLSAKAYLEGLVSAARGGVALVAASASVGIIMGVVTLTGIGTRFPSALLPLAEQNLVLALLLIMAATIVLGMGLPSAVCYLLMATLIGPVVSQLGIVPLGAHLFIFYFGMMSMVTPPVALAAYTAASIAGSNIMQSSFAAFRFALVGFTLPFMFVFRPELLLLGGAGSDVAAGGVLYAVVVAVLGIIPLAAGLSGYLLGPLSMASRAVLWLSSVLLLYPGRLFWIPWPGVSAIDLAGAVLFSTIVASQLRDLRRAA